MQNMIYHLSFVFWSDLSGGKLLCMHDLDSKYVFCSFILWNNVSHILSSGNIFGDRDGVDRTASFWHSSSFGGYIIYIPLFFWLEAIATIWLRLYCSYLTLQVHLSILHQPYYCTQDNGSAYIFGIMPAWTNKVWSKVEEINKSKAVNKTWEYANKVCFPQRCFSMNFFHLDLISSLLLCYPTFRRKEKSNPADRKNGSLGKLRTS